MRVPGVNIKGFYFLLLSIYIFSNSLYSIELDLSGSKFKKEYLEKKLEPDKIKAIKEPSFSILKNAVAEKKLNYLNDDDWLVLVEFNNIKKLYPIKSLIWHEIVNDEFGSKPICPSYCILTGSAVVFESLSNNKKRSFGVSGYLYNSNLVMNDYQTGSLWPQLYYKGFSGKENKSALKLVPFSLLKFSYAKKTCGELLICTGSDKMPEFRTMYDRRPFEGLDNYETDNGTRAVVPEYAIKDKKYFIKDQFLYFPKHNTAIPFNSLEKYNGTWVNITKENNAIAEIRPIEGKEFFNLYWFAVKAFYRNAEILE